MLPIIPDGEFVERRSAATQAAVNEELGGLLIWSRGGNTVEAYGDVFYLSNFHSPFPVVADRASWASRGHAALILPSEGEPILITDYLDDRGEHIKVADVRVVPDITAATVEALAGRGLHDKRIGLVGGSSFLASAERRMRSHGSGSRLNFVPCDHILERLRSVKSEGELEVMRHAARCGASRGCSWREGGWKWEL